MDLNNLNSLEFKKPILIPSVKNYQKYFNHLCDSVFALLDSHEKLSINLEAEDSLFVRFNQSRIRQNSNVHQFVVKFIYQSHLTKIQEIHATANLGFQFFLFENSDFDMNPDLNIMKNLLFQCRQIAPTLPECLTPILIQNNGQVETTKDTNSIPEFSVIIKDILESVQKIDFAGLLSLGYVIQAVQNSLGQKHWFANWSLVLDYSIFTQNVENENKCIKGLYADTQWNLDHFKKLIHTDLEQLSMLTKANRQILPGKYKVYLSPAAVAEILQNVSWSCLGAQSYKYGYNPFKDLIDGKKSLSPLFSISENRDLGLSSPFNQLGEVSPKQVQLIQNGKFKNLLVSSRSAKEFNMDGNNAETNECPKNLDVASGALASDKILAELGCGIFVNNLHYINWSEQSSARVTGMTRYACFWVENGKIIAPIQDLRFDVSLYEAFGENLMAVTDFSEIQPNTSTYDQRNLGGMKTPGMIIKDFNFTL